MAAVKNSWRIVALKMRYLEKRIKQAIKDARKMHNTRRVKELKELQIKLREGIEILELYIRKMSEDDDERLKKMKV